MVEQDKDVTTPASRQAKISSTSAANVGTRKKSTKKWTRSAYGTRGASKRAQAVALQEESKSSGGVVNAIFDKDPTNYSEAMRSANRDGWVKAMEEEVEALQNNKVWQVVKCAPGLNALHTK